METNKQQQQNFYPVLQGGLQYHPMQTFNQQQIPQAFTGAPTPTFYTYVQQPPPVIPQEVIVDTLEDVAPTQYRTVPDSWCYLGGSLLACLFCCWPLGIIAVLLSFRTMYQVKHGDVTGAWRSAKRTRVLIALTIICGLAVFAGVILLVLGQPMAHDDAD